MLRQKIEHIAKVLYQKEENHEIFVLVNLIFLGWVPSAALILLLAIIKRNFRGAGEHGRSPRPAPNEEAQIHLAAFALEAESIRPPPLAKTTTPAKSRFNSASIREARDGS